MSETLRTDGDRTVLRIERRFRHAREKVWSAITEPAQLSRWFPATVELKPLVGAEVRFDFGDGKGPSADGRVTEFDPPRSFGFSWGGELLHWELRVDGDGCLMIFHHTFDDRYGAASFCSGWVECLNALEQVTDGGPVTHAPPSAELHDRYVGQFSLDAGLADVGDQGWLVRFERQLTRPAETVWPLLERMAATTPGPVVEFEAPRVLERAAHTDRPGRVRWELRDGTGHGARLVLTQTGPPATVDDADAALPVWREHIQRLADDLRHRQD